MQRDNLSNALSLEEVFDTKFLNEIAGDLQTVNKVIPSLIASEDEQDRAILNLVRHDLETLIALI